MSLVIRGMQIQTTIRYHLIPMRIAITKRQNNNADKDVEKRLPFYDIDETVN